MICLITKHAPMTVTAESGPAKGQEVVVCRHCGKLMEIDGTPTQNGEHASVPEELARVEER